MDKTKEQRRWAAADRRRVFLMAGHKVLDLDLEGILRRKLDALPGDDNDPHIMRVELNDRFGVVQLKDNGELPEDEVKSEDFFALAALRAAVACEQASIALLATNGGKPGSFEVELFSQGRVQPSASPGGRWIEAEHVAGRIAAVLGCDECLALELWRTIVTALFKGNVADLPPFKVERSPSHMFLTLRFDAPT